MYLGGPTKSPTPAEFAFIFILGAASLIALGIIVEIAALRAPPEDHERAVALSQFGLLFIGFGVGIALIYWLYRRLSD